MESRSGLNMRITADYSLIARGNGEVAVILSHPLGMPPWPSSPSTLTFERSMDQCVLRFESLSIGFDAPPELLEVARKLGVMLFGHSDLKQKIIQSVQVTRFE